MLLPDLELPPSVESDLYDLGFSGPMLDVEYREPPRSSHVLCIERCVHTLQVHMCAAVDTSSSEKDSDVFRLGLRFISSACLCLQEAEEGTLTHQVWGILGRLLLRGLQLSFYNMR
eukprot:732595-Amphidinium_carterae.1